MSESKPYGSWLSPITAQVVAKAAADLDQPQLDNGNLYWLEFRPWENGRNVIMQRDSAGHIKDILPDPLSARTRVHEYGGAPYLVSDHIVYFCLDSDQQIYRLDLNQPNPQPEPVTLTANRRYADLALDKKRHRLIATCEEHNPQCTSAGHGPDNFIVAISLDGSHRQVTLAEGADFYSNARVSPCGKQLSWLCWRHPNMPWDETELWSADISASGTLATPSLIAGATTQNKPESVFQPQWHPDGILFFASDRHNWWNLFSTATDGEAVAISHSQRNTDSEFAMPQWVFGMSTFGFLDSQTVACIYSRKGFWQLAIIDLPSGQLSDIETPYTSLQAINCHNGTATFIGAAANLAPQVATYQKGDHSTQVAYQSGPLPVCEDFLARPKTISFASGGDASNAQAHAFLYPPTNPGFSAPADAKPPLIVMCHGGPTAASNTALNFKIQYWTSRGFMVADVNYRGSTGYGRHYRDALKGQWGVADVDDAVNVARHLVNTGKVNPEQLAIRGGSAGGYTVLSALTFHNTFKAGASLYGIGDLELLVAGTHKFEAHYTDTLVGPYPEEKTRYRERSPIHHIDQLTCPVIFLQGLDDKVVPPNQAELMVEALCNRDIPVAYVPFPGEGHGFRKAANIKTALESELYFYSRVFDFELAGSIEPIRIDNLATSD